MWKNYLQSSPLQPKMERLQDGGKKISILARALEQCRSFGRPRRPQKPNYLRRCRSWNEGRSNAGGRRPRAPPGGCVAVHVGPGKERFVIEMECVNHPLFKVLLDEAESVYGFANLGPLELPCEVDRFYEVLYEMEYREKEVAQAKRGGSAAAGYQQLRPSSLMVTAGSA